MSQRNLSDAVVPNSQALYGPLTAPLSNNPGADNEALRQWSEVADIAILTPMETNVERQFIKFSKSSTVASI